MTIASVEALRFVRKWSAK